MSHITILKQVKRKCIIIIIIIIIIHLLFSCNDHYIHLKNTIKKDFFSLQTSHFLNV